MKKLIELRPHHLLCIKNFIGEGYSKEFVENISYVIRTLEGNSEKLIKIKVDLDDICSKCPENKNTFCNSEEKVSTLDKKAMESLDIHHGNEISWSDLKTKVSQIITPEKFEQICNHCSWYYICGNKK